MNDVSPYREGGGGPPCPRCLSPMVASERRLTCAISDCGEWWRKDAIAPTVDWKAVEGAEPYRMFGAVDDELPCPECTSAMITSLRAKIEFAHCDAHGVWLPRAYRAAFDELGGWSVVLAVSIRRKR